MEEEPEGKSFDSENGASSGEKDNNSASSNQTNNSGKDSSSHASNLVHAGAQEAKKDVTKKAKSSVRKWIVGGGIGFTGIGGLFVIFFLLLLFKNVAMRDLFMDYEFAKFDRVFSERIQKAVKEAQPEGDEDTQLTEETAPGTETPEDNLTQASKADIDALKSDPAQEQDFTRSAENFDESPLGTGGEVDAEFGVDLSAPDLSNESDQDAENQTKADLEGKEAGTDPATTVATDSDPLNAAESAEDAAAAAPGATAASIQGAAVKAFSGGLFGIVSKASGPMFFVTLGCIAVDIYDKLFSVIQSFQLAGLVRTASASATYADCQKLGKCSLAQDGAVAGEYDNGKQSVTQSAGYERATGQAVNPANDLSASMRPGDPPTGGTMAELLGLGERVDHSMSDVGISSVCGAILNPIVQAAMAILNIGATIFAAVTGAIDLGASDVATAVVETTAIILGSKIGTALVIHAASSLSKTAFQHLDPIQLGNATDAGWKVRATDTCRYDGCRQLTPAENQQETLDTQNAEIQTFNQQSLASRMFNINDPYSVADLMVMQIPTSPDAMIASFQTGVGTITSPIKLIASIKSFAAELLNPTDALAADTTTLVESDTYGIPDYGLPDAEVNAWTIRDNTAWVAQNMPAYKSWAQTCLTPTFNQIMLDESARAGNITGANPGAEDECSATDVADEHFQIYTLDLRVTGDLAMMFNNHTGSTSN